MRRLILARKGELRLSSLFVLEQLLNAHLSRSRKPAEDLANESRSTHITVAADMVFSLSHHLSGVGSA
jgi:hypothetical protein